MGKDDHPFPFSWFLSSDLLENFPGWSVERKAGNFPLSAVSKSQVKNPKDKIPRIVTILNSYRQKLKKVAEM